MERTTFLEPDTGPLAFVCCGIFTLAAAAGITYLVGGVNRCHLECGYGGDGRAQMMAVWMCAR